MSPVWSFAAAFIGYLLGSLPFGYVVARAHGVDIFKEGSGNPGATNVKRVLGEKFGRTGKNAGNLVFVLDAVKGALAASWLMFTPLAYTDARLLGLIGVIAAVLGHSFSVFTKFKGGKGVATAAGGLVVSWLRGNPLPFSIVATALGAFVIFRHRANIRRLLAGTEPKFAKKPAPGS